MKIRPVGAPPFHADRRPDNKRNPLYLLHAISKEIKTVMVPLKIINRSVFGMVNRCVLCHVGTELWNTACPGQRHTKIHAYVLVPKRFMKFVFNSVQSNSKRFLCTSVHFNVGTCCSSADIWTIFKLLPRVYQHVSCYKLNCFNDNVVSNQPDLELFSCTQRP